MRTHVQAFRSRSGWCLAASSALSDLRHRQWCSGASGKDASAAFVHAVNQVSRPLPSPPHPSPSRPVPFHLPSGPVPVPSPAVSGNGVSIHSPKTWMDILWSPNAAACIALDCPSPAVGGGNGTRHDHRRSGGGWRRARPHRRRLPAQGNAAGLSGVVAVRRSSPTSQFCCAVFSCRFTGSLGAGIAIIGAGIAIYRCRNCDLSVPVLRFIGAGIAISYRVTGLPVPSPPALAVRCPSPSASAARGPQPYRPLLLVSTRCLRRPWATTVRPTPTRACAPAIASSPYIPLPPTAYRWVPHT